VTEAETKISKLKILSYPRDSFTLIRLSDVCFELKKLCSRKKKSVNNFGLGRNNDFVSRRLGLKTLVSFLPFKLGINFDPTIIIWVWNVWLLNKWSTFRTIHLNLHLVNSFGSFSAQISRSFSALRVRSF
jgi:hypothetical protein